MSYLVPVVKMEPLVLSQEDHQWLSGGLARRLSEALLKINNQCDGARRVDGVGFNKFDAPRVGPLLTKFPEEWTAADLRLAEHLAGKYVKQLALMGVDLQSDVIQGRT